MVCSFFQPLTQKVKKMSNELLRIFPKCFLILRHVIIKSVCMKKTIVTLWGFLLSLGFAFPNVIDVDPDKTNWGDDPDRVGNGSALISCDDNSLYVYSEKSLPSLYVYIVDSRGIVKYADVQSVSSCGTLSVDISQLPVGNYTVYLYSGTDYLTASLFID